MATLIMNGTVDHISELCKVSIVYKYIQSKFGSTSLFSFFTGIGNGRNVLREKRQNDEQSGPNCPDALRGRDGRDGATGRDGANGSPGRDGGGTDSLVQ